MLVAVPKFGGNSVRWGCCATRGTSERGNEGGERARERASKSGGSGIMVFIAVASSIWCQGPARRRSYGRLTGLASIAGIS